MRPNIEKAEMPGLVGQGRRKEFLLAAMTIVFIRGPGPMIRNSMKVGDWEVGLRTGNVAYNPSSSASDDKEKGQ